MYSPNVRSHTIFMFRPSGTVRTDYAGLLSALESNVSGEISVPAIDFSTHVAWKSTWCRVHVATNSCFDKRTKMFSRQPHSPVTCKFKKKFNVSFTSSYLLFFHFPPNDSIIDACVHIFVFMYSRVLLLFF